MNIAGNILEHLTQNEKDLIVRLPYRVGLWISQSDETGGEQSEAAEMTALSNIIQGFTEQVFGSEDVQYIMAETLRQKNDWPNWADNMGDVPDECMRAYDVLTLHLDEKEMNAFRTRILEIGEAVALAFREEEPAKPSYEGAFSITRILGILRLYSRDQKDDAYHNISAKERAALHLLAQALNAPEA